LGTQTTRLPHFSAQVRKSRNSPNVVLDWCSHLISKGCKCFSPLGYTVLCPSLYAGSKLWRI